MVPASDLFRDWKEADEIARKFEDQLIEKLSSTSDEGTPPPSAKDWDEARCLRARANTLLDTALEKLRDEDAKWHKLRGADQNGDEEDR